MYTSQKKSPKSPYDYMKLSDVVLCYKPKIPLKDLPTITSSPAAYDILKRQFGNCMYHHEEFAVIALNNKNSMVGLKTLFVGGLESVNIDPRVIFQFALGCNASGIITAHNHPSQNLTPSHADDELVKLLIKQCVIMQIRFLDNLIVCNHSFYSFADEGYLL